MPELLPHRAPPRRQFIPDADPAFADMAERFAAAIAREPDRYMLTAEIAAQITRAAKAFRDALTIASAPGKRTKFTIDDKNAARATAERIVRKYGAIIRANPDIPSIDKESIGVYERPSRVSKATIPPTPPVLTYHGPGVEAALGADMTSGRGGRGGGGGTHILKFHTELGCGKRKKPWGAARVEVFVDLVPPGQKIPRHPGEGSGGSGGGRPWYLRSFTTSRMEVQFPMPSQPMLVVYWARWASATGEVGRFSRTCIARQEGWTSRPALPEGEGALATRGRVETKYVVIHSPYALPEHLEGDDALAGLGQAMLEAAQQKMLDAAR